MRRKGWTALAAILMAISAVLLAACDTEIRVVEETDKRVPARFLFF